MIINLIFDWFFSVVVSGFFEGLSDLDFTSFYSVWETLIGVLRSICYFLPMDTVSSIFSIVIILATFRIVISILKTIWGILPFA